MRQCPKCGSELSEDDQFCHKCGAYSDELTQQPDMPKPKFKKPNANWASIAVVAIILIAVAFGTIFFVTGGMDFDKKTTENVAITVDGLTLKIDPKVAPGDQLYRFEDGYRLFVQVTIDGKTSTSPIYCVEKDGVLFVPPEGKNVIHVDNVKINSKIIINLYAKTPGVDNVIDIYSEKGASVKVEKYGVSGVIIDKSEVKDKGKITLSGDTYPMAELTLSFVYTS